MNKTRRGLELAAAIVAIVVNSILAFIFLMAMLMWSSISNVPGMDEEFYMAWAMFGGAVFVIFVFMVLFSVASIVLGALLCKKPKPNAEGLYTRRLGLGIPLTILNAIVAIIMISSGLILLFIAALAVVGLEIAAMCVEPNAKPQPAAATAAPVNNANEKIAEITRMRNAGFITEEQYKEAMEKAVASNAPTANKTVDEQLAELKKYKELGILTEEQYQKGVSDLINKNS